MQRLKRHYGVMTVHVDFAAATAQITYDCKRMTVDELLRLVEEAGFEASVVRR